jgi:hypothetical protein
MDPAQRRLEQILSLPDPPSQADLAEARKLLVTPFDPDTYLPRPCLLHLATNCSICRHLFQSYYLCNDPGIPGYGDFDFVHTRVLTKQQVLDQYGIDPDDYND